MEVIQQVCSEAASVSEHPPPDHIPAEQNLAVPAVQNLAGSITEPSAEENTPVSPGGMMHASVDCSTSDDAVMQDAAQSVAYELKPENGAVGDAEYVGGNESIVSMPNHSTGFDSASIHTQSIGYDSANMPLHFVGGDPVNGSVNEVGGYQSSVAIENGVASNVEGAPAADHHSEEVNSPEEDRLWSMVKANCLDFNAWTALIDETERVSENNILKIRKVYDAFLYEFPLCFGYWKKYADHEGRLGGVDKIVEVYERAVSAVTYSVDIWLHYCLFAISTYDDRDTIRRIFERGLAFVGTDYLSFPLWDEYIRYEEAHQDWCYLAMIYTRILDSPIQQLDRYFNCLKELATSRTLSEIVTPEELFSLTSGTEPSEGEVHSDGVEQSAKPVSAGLTEAEQLEKYIAIREELYKKAKEFESKIIGFETAIRRPYFHIRPLDDPELENWHNYLDLIEKEQDISKVIKLYERCVIACANYPEFWIRYVLCMEAFGDMNLAYNCLTRATHVFVKKQPEIHFFAAKFKELSGDIMGARAEYQYLYTELSPCLLEAIVKQANMEYRQGDKEIAYSTYEKIIAAEQEKDQSDILPMLLVQYSRFLYLVAGDLEKAREFLSRALDHMELSKPVLETVIHLESIQPHSKRVDYLDALVEKFISPDSIHNTTDREEISCIFLEFLDLFGDVKAIRKAETRHTKLFLRQKRKLVSKKRQADDCLGSDKTKLSKSSTDAASPTQSALGAYPNAQNQWSAGYGQRPSWPQTSQAQAQQWNPGYAPQPAYPTYGYTNYAAPQVPLSSAAPQSAAYGSYPPSYPVQAYPQQNYAQPAAAAAPFPQQQAAAPQPYYGSYY